MGDKAEAATRRNFLRASAAGSLALVGVGWHETSGAGAHAAGPGPGPLKTETVPVALMLSSQLKAKLSALQMRQATADSQYAHEGDLVPRATFRHASVWRGSREQGNFQHHQQIGKFQGRYYVAWSNGLLDEEGLGQQVLVAHSADGLQWSDPQPAVARSQGGDGLVYNSVGLLATDKELFLYCWTYAAIRDANAPRGRRMEPGTNRIDLYASSDGKQWTLRTPKLLHPGRDHGPMMEAPRRMREGVLLCGGSQNGPVVFRWPGGDPTHAPEVIRVPPSKISFPYGEATWYQTADGLIVMFWRDEAKSLQLYVNTSTDGGLTWTPPILSDIPNSMQRVYAGTLPDGRHYLINDANPRLLDRRQLTIALSKDGRTFDSIYMLVDDPVRQRFPGGAKVNGWQYPCALVDGSKMLVAYSVNKEDIECGVLDLTRI
jgi:hypothetical protein